MSKYAEELDKLLNFLNFELNDEYTLERAKNITESYLAGLKSSRDILDYKVFLENNEIISYIQPINTSTQKAYDDMTEQERMDILHELMQCSVC